MGDYTKTLICYYQGAYGPTIRIEVKEREWLEYFKKSILSLIEGGVPEVKIDCLDNVEVADLESLTLIKAQCIRYQKVLKQNNCFNWFQDIEELITLVGLIDGLLEGSGSGHQYLVDDEGYFIIVLSYNE